MPERLADASPAFLLFFVNPLKHHIVSVISIIKRTIHAADCRRRSACLLCNFQISLLFPEHFRHFKSLRQRKQFINRANIFKKNVTLFFIFQTENRFKKIIYCLCPDFYSYKLLLFTTAAYVCLNDCVYNSFPKHCYILAH